MKKQWRVAILLTALMTVAGAVAVPPQITSAAATISTVTFLSPVPAAQAVKGTQYLFEVEVQGTPGYNYSVDFDKSFDGSGAVDSNWPPIGQLLTVSAQADGSGIALMRFPSVPLAPTCSGNQCYRARAYESGTTVYTYKSGTLPLVDSLQFNGAMWIGATTPICTGGSNAGVQCVTDADCLGGGKCGGDAPGWVSASCRNPWGANCAAPTTYSMVFAPSGSYATLQNNTWAGEADNGAGALGWVTWNKKYCATAVPTYKRCASAKNFGQTCNSTGDSECDGTLNSCQDWSGGICASDADCGGVAGSCAVAGSLPSDQTGDEQWSTFNALNRYYTSQVTEKDTSNNDVIRYPGQLAGWAKFLTYGQNDGWVHLRGAEAPKRICVGGTNDGNACTNANECNPPAGTCKNNLNSVYSDLIADASVHPFQQCTDCTSGSNPILCTTCTTVQVTSLSQKNYSCNSCHTCTTSGGFTSCNSCDGCNAYGVSFDQQNAKLVGYGWAGAEADGGLGWVNFDKVSANAILQAWLQTQYGDIFSGNDVTLNAPTNQHNATYLIQAGGAIVAQIPADTGVAQPSYPSISFPASTNQYINVLGRLDFTEMLKNIDTLTPNRYGIAQTLLDIVPLNNTILGGKIYYHTGDLTIANALTFLAGDGTTPSGAGTFIVDGDLTIANDVRYDPSSGTALTNIPSIAWIVRGDVKIKGSVQQVVGTFFALGCPGGSAPCGSVVKNGEISTASDGNYSAGQLNVSGLMMAKQFIFQRSLLNNNTAAESVVYDGRFIANPPPGLQNLAALMPTVRQITP